MNLPAVCMTLLISGGPSVHTAPTPSDESAAHAWFEVMGVLAPFREQVDFALKQWQIWNGTTAETRAANFAYEMRRISPPATDNVVALNRPLQLVEQSAENLARLKTQISAKRRFFRQPDRATLEKVGELSRQLSFHYLKPYTIARETGVYAPLASPRELAKLGLSSAPGFYSKMVGDSASVEFKPVAAKADVGPLSLNTEIPYRAYRLHQDLAAEAGFATPYIPSANAALNFLAEWEPQLLERLRFQSRYSLPFGVNTVDRFINYLDPARIKEVFPEHSAYDRLSLLREQLHRYVLSESDFRDLMIWSFELWLTEIAVHEPRDFERIQKEFSLKAGPQNVFAKQFMTDFPIPEFVLRVPVAVGPKSYSIATIEASAYNPFPDYGRTRQSAWDSRRLDHNTKP